MSIVRRHGLKLVGIHMRIGSAWTTPTCPASRNAMVDVVASIGHDIEAISAGGGLSIPYREGDPRIDCDHYFEQWDAARKRIAQRLGHDIRLEIEPGRFMVAEAGALVAEVHSINRRPERDFALVDAGFNDLMRPAIRQLSPHFGARADGGQPQDAPETRIAVAGPLCESGDVFTQDAGGVMSDQLLPRPRIGDFLVFHSAGAYGSSMSSNYNSPAAGAGSCWTRARPA